MRKNRVLFAGVTENGVRPYKLFRVTLASARNSKTLTTFGATTLKHVSTSYTLHSLEEAVCTSSTLFFGIPCSFCHRRVL
jgi:hypothetical protein